MDIQTKSQSFTHSIDYIGEYLLSILSVGITTGILFAIGRRILGEGSIALLFLIPIVWCTIRWGQGPGFVAAITSALAFDFLFIPPFYTFSVGSLEGWLILIIFTAVAVLIVGRIQRGIVEARRREREAIFVAELSLGLASTNNLQAAINLLAHRLQKIFLADLVQVTIDSKSPQSSHASFPEGKAVDRSPDREVPIQADGTYLGEIMMWRGKFPLPRVDDVIMKDIVRQSAYVIDRFR